MLLNKDVVKANLQKNSRTNFTKNGYSTKFSILGLPNLCKIKFTILKKTFFTKICEIGILIFYKLY